MSMQQARELLQEALDLTPRCFHCQSPAVYSCPTAAIGDRILTCEEHKGAEGNEFGDTRYPLLHYRLHQKIVTFLEATKEVL